MQAGEGPKRRRIAPEGAGMHEIPPGTLRISYISPYCKDFGGEAPSIPRRSCQGNKKSLERALFNVYMFV